MNNPLGVSPSKGKQGNTRGKEKTLLTSVGIEPTTSRLDLPLLRRLIYEVFPVLRGTTFICTYTIKGHYRTIMSYFISNLSVDVLIFGLLYNLITDLDKQEYGPTFINWKRVECS